MTQLDLLNIWSMNGDRQPRNEEEEGGFGIPDEPGDIVVWEDARS